MTNYEEEEEFAEYCEALRNKYTAVYLCYLIAHPIAIATPDPEYTEDF